MKNKKITAEMLKEKMVVETYKFGEVYIREIKKGSVYYNYLHSGNSRKLKDFCKNVKEIISTPETSETQSKKMIDGDKLLEFLNNDIKNLRDVNDDYDYGYMMAFKQIKEKILSMQKENE